MGKPNGREHHTEITATPTSHARTEVFREISQIKMTSIVCTPARLVDLLEHFDGVFAQRETTFNFGGRGNVSVSNVPLQRHELEKLGDIIPRVLRETAGAPEQDEDQALRREGAARGSKSR